MKSHHGLKPAALYTLLAVCVLCVILDLVTNLMDARFNLASDVVYLITSFLLTLVSWRFRLPSINRLIATDPKHCSIELEPKAFTRFGCLVLLVCFSAIVGQHLF
jgi:hypothetical protein